MSDSVRSAAAVVIMYVLLYSTTINNVLFTTVGRQMSCFEPSLPCVCVFFSFFSRSSFGWVSGLLAA